MERSRELRPLIRSRPYLTSAISLCAASLFASANSVEAQSKSILEKDSAVKMRDGVILRADVLLPSVDGKFPILVYRTPYGKDNAPKEWTTFNKAVKRG